MKTNRIVTWFVLTIAACTAPAPVPSLTDRSLAINQTATPPASAAPATHVATSKPAAELDDIVVDPSDPPTGLTNSSTGNGQPVLTRVVLSPRAQEFLSLQGFEDARYTDFSGDRGILLTLVIRFDDVTYATSAFDLYLDELGSEDGWGLNTDTDAGLGDEGTCAEGDTPIGIYETICLWRSGRLILITGGSIPGDELRAIARAMDRRAA